MDIYCDGSDDDDDEDDFGDNEEEVESEEGETVAQRIYARGNNDLTGVVGGPPSDGRPSKPCDCSSTGTCIRHT